MINAIAPEIRIALPEWADFSAHMWRELAMICRLEIRGLCAANACELAADAVEAGYKYNYRGMDET